jgi:hypothetical protein
MYTPTVHETFALNRMKEFFASHGIEAVTEDDDDMLWFIVKNSFDSPPGMKQALEQARDLVKSLEKKKLLQRHPTRGDAPDLISLVESD